MKGTPSSRSGSMLSLNDDLQHDLQWTDDTVNAGQLFHKYGKQFPVIVKITNGIFGKNEIDVLSAGQMVRIHGVIKQTRVLAIDRRGRLMSIPEDYAIKFHVIGKKEKRKKARPLREVLKAYHLPVSAMFSKGSKWRLQIGPRQYYSDTFGKFDLLKKYDESFFIGHTFVDGEVDPRVTLVPCYLDLNMKIATGMCNTGREAWKLYQNNMTRAVGAIKYKQVPGPKDILLFGETRLLKHDNGKNDAINNILGQGEQSRLLSILAVLLKSDGNFMSEFGSMKSYKHTMEHSSMNGAGDTGTTKSTRSNLSNQSNLSIISVPLGESKTLVLSSGNPNNTVNTIKKHSTQDEHVTRVILGDNGVLPVITFHEHEGFKPVHPATSHQSTGHYATLDDYKPRGVLKRNTRLSSSTGNLYASVQRNKNGIYWGPSEYTADRAASEIGVGNAGNSGVYGRAGDTVGERGVYGTGVLSYGTMIMSADGRDKTSDYGTYGDITTVPIFNKLNTTGEWNSVSRDLDRRMRSQSLPGRAAKRQKSVEFARNATTGRPRSMAINNKPASIELADARGRQSHSSTQQYIQKIVLTETPSRSEPDLRVHIDDLYAKPNKRRKPPRSNSLQNHDVRVAERDVRVPEHHVKVPERDFRDVGHYETLTFDRKETRFQETRRNLKRTRSGGHSDLADGRLLIMINEEGEEGDSAIVLTSKEDITAEDRTTKHPVLSQPFKPEPPEPRPRDNPTDGSGGDHHVMAINATMNVKVSEHNLQPSQKTDERYSEDSDNDTTIESVPEVEMATEQVVTTEELTGDHVTDSADTLKKLDSKDARYDGTLLIHSADLPSHLLPKRHLSGDAEDRWKTHDRQEVFWEGAGPEGRSDDLEYSRSRRLTTLETLGGVTNASADSFEFDCHSTGRDGERQDGMIDLDDAQMIYTAPVYHDDVTNDSERSSEGFLRRTSTTRSYNVIKIGENEDEVAIEQVEESSVSDFGVPGPGSGYGGDPDGSVLGGEGSSVGFQSDKLDQGDRKEGDTDQEKESDSPASPMNEEGDPWHATLNKEERIQRLSQMEMAASHLLELDTLLKASMVGATDDDDESSSTHTLCEEDQQKGSGQKAGASQSSSSTGTIKTASLVPDTKTEEESNSPTKSSIPVTSSVEVSTSKVVMRKKVEASDKAPKEQVQDIQSSTLTGTKSSGPVAKDNAQSQSNSMQRSKQDSGSFVLRHLRSGQHPASQENTIIRKPAKSEQPAQPEHQTQPEQQKQTEQKTVNSSVKSLRANYDQTPEAWTGMFAPRKHHSPYHQRKLELTKF